MAPFFIIETPIKIVLKNILNIFQIIRIIKKQAGLEDYLRGNLNEFF